MRTACAPHVVLRLLALTGLVVAAPGCGGEVDVTRFVVRPALEDYRTHIQPMLVAMQCSAAPCHGTTFVGEVRITAEPDDEALYRDYQSIKALTNPQDPDASVLLSRLLNGAAGASHVPLCFQSTDDCTYRKLVAWIGWDGDGPGPGDIECDYTGETCFR
ncbi:MAG: hypothetical protein H6702_16590 [Myxococcales bacterium]|nr:hypothetical protein [Myxococcales bacterium]